MSTQNYSRGDVVFLEGQAAKRFYIVQSGRVACVKKHDRLVVTYIAGKGDFVAEETVLGFRRKHDHSAVVLEDCELVEVPAEDVQKIVNSKSEWIRNILVNMSEKIKNTSDSITEHRIEDDRLYKGESLKEEDYALIQNKLI